MRAVDHIFISRWDHVNAGVAVSNIDLRLSKEMTMIEGNSYTYMKWVGISGSWRKLNKEIEEEVRSTVRNVMADGKGIVTGGALGVDFLATDEALKEDPKAERIKVFLPTTLEKYAEHYRRHAMLGTITYAQAEDLIKQLTNLRTLNPKALIENPDTNFRDETKQRMYYERNSRVVDASDELIAFRVKTKRSQSMGTDDAVKKAHVKGIPVELHMYDFADEIKTVVETE